MIKMLTIGVKCKEHLKKCKRANNDVINKIFLADAI
jgi:hypothetical protein